MADTIGMMNLAYAISKIEVLKWINDTLKVLSHLPSSE